MKILLSGGSGFVGGYVKRVLTCSDLVDDAGPIDLGDIDRLYNIIVTDKPDAVIHLAAQSSVPDSFENPLKTYETNFTGTYNLLHALEKAGFKGRFLYVSSSDVYGLVPESEQPISESRLLSPRSPYAVSKVAAEALCYQWSQTGPFKCIVARPFNHIGAGQDSRFVVSNFAKQLVEIKAGIKEPVIYVGDIDVSRDFTDVKDVVIAYKQLIEQGQNGEIYNICSGKSHVIREILQSMIDILQVEVTIKQDLKRMRKSEQRKVCGSYSKINNMLGWMPSIHINDTILDVLENWENKINE